MAVYRKQWKATNGHTYTLDIVPHDEVITGAVTTLSSADANLIEVGNMTWAFDELPVGLMKPPELTLKVVINRLPSALQTYLREKQDFYLSPAGYRRNMFILKTDQGTGANVILFVGVQAKINSQTYERQTGEYLVEIELVDALQYVLSTYGPASLTNFVNMNSNNAYYHLDRDAVFELLRGVDQKRYQSLYRSSGYDDRAILHKWEDVWDSIATSLSSLLSLAHLRQTATSNVFDYTARWKSSDVTDIAQFRISDRVTDAAARTAGTALGPDSLYLLTHVVAPDWGAEYYPGEEGYTLSDRLIAGLASTTDKYGWAQYESTWDLLKDLCENLFVKASYTYTYGTGGEANNIFVTWSLLPIISSSVASVDILDSLDEPQVTETESAIGRCEVRYETEYNDATASQIISNAGVVRADRQYTVNMVMHNNPLFKSKRPGDIYDNGFLHTNLFWFRDTGATTGNGSENAVKVHENMYLRWGSGTSDKFTYGESTLSHNPPKDRELHQPWCVAVQKVTGLPYALADAYVKVFGRDDVATLQLRTRLDDYAFTVGSRYAITGAITTDIPHLAWTNAVATSVETSIMDGTQTTTFMLIPTPV